jgi:hypothetical protein
MNNITVYIFFLLLSSYVLRHCRYFQGAYTKVPLEHATINTNHIICIITKEFYWRTENIVYILREEIQFETRIDTCGHDIIVTDISTSFSHSNNKLCYRSINNITLYFTYIVTLTSICTSDITTNVCLL